MGKLMMNRLMIVACILALPCIMAYEEGGYPAVFSSTEWVFSAENSHNSTKNCQFSTLQGRRDYQEDRVTCNLHMKLPFSGEDGAEEITIGIAAIFDGHGGDEASEMASRKLLGYFYMHVMSYAYERASPINKENDQAHTVNSSQRKLPMIDRRSLLRILEEALLKTIQDIDTEFTKACLSIHFFIIDCSYNTLLVSLVYRKHWTKAIFLGNSLKEVYVAELTKDHHPDRADEKARIEAAGGFVRTYGVPRVNGILAVSRSIGDLYLKRYGVVPDPEVTGWKHFTQENKYLVVASDGVFETLTPQDVCDLVHYKASKSSSGNLWSSYSLADWIIHSAFKTGSTDNLSAIVISDLLE
ncbi:hypothetical protein RD792_003321 [Penstemon davidsonii]|uniref:PPM-type phosphatase domain-containing protein n=1 Tax=Penstemon davidsonii TaxID=160366 RepID=A0ABR0DTF6_9LAMI|nr:hypothetical protein RD792_003321 [Penstemon davidsonii]